MRLFELEIVDYDETCRRNLQKPLGRTFAYFSKIRKQIISPKAIIN